MINGPQSSRRRSAMCTLKAIITCRRVYTARIARRLEILARQQYRVDSLCDSCCELQRDETVTLNTKVCTSQTRVFYTALHAVAHYRKTNANSNDVANLLNFFSQNCIILSIWQQKIAIKFWTSKFQATRHSVLLFSYSTINKAVTYPSLNYQ